MNSLEVVRDHPKLLLFPIISGVAMISIFLTLILSMASVLGIGSAVFQVDEWNFDPRFSEGLGYLILFAFYLVNYFVVVFFNVGLVYNVREIFAGRTVSIMDGMKYAAGRLRTILAWSALAATVGTILRILEDKTGFFGKILVGLVGFAWGVMTYFVVPVLAYEDLGPADAVKRSVSIIKEKWGESIGAGFSFGLLTLVGIIGSFLGMGVLFALEWYLAGVAFVLVGVLLTIILSSTAKTVFLAAAYEHTVDGSPNRYFEGAAMDQLFYQK